MLVSRQVLRKKRLLVAVLMLGQGRECVEMLDPPEPPEPPCVHKIECVLQVLLPSTDPLNPRIVECVPESGCHSCSHWLICVDNDYNVENKIVKNLNISFYSTS